MATSLDPMSPVPPMTTIFMICHRRHRLVVRHETLSEIAREVVVRGFRLGLEDPADGIAEAALHVEPRECGEDALHLIGWNLVVLEPSVVEGYARGAKGNF